MSDCLEYFKDMEQGLHEIKGRGIGILGTKINAGFASMLLDSIIDYFFDENPSKQGSFFHGKPVRHPETVTKTDVVILPYGQSGNKIKEKFESKYKGIFVLFWAIFENEKIIKTDYINYSRFTYERKDYYRFNITEIFIFDRFELVSNLLLPPMDQTRVYKKPCAVMT